MKSKSQSSLFSDSSALSGATFSQCGQYRYLLWRHFNGPRIGRMVNFCMLNPSTADEADNDPTVERCCVRAKEWGFDSMFVTNIFGLRSTDPAGLKKVADPVGPENDSFLWSSANAAAMVVCAWGNHGKLNGRSLQVLEMFKMHCVPELRAFSITKTGEPNHPLYLGYSVQPQPWNPFGKGE